MELEGKKINLLGDSITAGAGVSDPAFSYPELLRRDLHPAELRNYGISATRIARRIGPDWVPHPNFCERVARMDPDADLVLVFGGTNDYGHGNAPFGTMTDRTDETFTGALHVLFSSLIEKYPGRPIVVLTPLHRRNEDDPLGERKSDGTSWKPDPQAPLSVFVDRITEVARYYSLPVLDLWAVSGLQPAVPVIREKFMPDGLHPNEAGCRVIADRIEGFLRAL